MPPIDKSFEGALKDWLMRLTLVERRLAISGGGGGGGGPAQPGSVIPWTSNVVPTGWLLCDGSAVARSAYPALFDTIGTAFGAGDGTSTFNLPDFRGRIPVGRNSADTDFDVLGETGGHKQSFVKIAWEAAGRVILNRITSGLPTWISNVWSTSSTAVPITSSSSASQTIGIETVNYAGQGGTLQPYQVVNYIIATGASSIVPQGTTLTALTRRGNSTTQNVTTTEQTALWSVTQQTSGHFSFDNTTNTFTCVIPGQYRMTASLGWGSIGAGNLDYTRVNFYKNGVLYTESVGRRDSIGGITNLNECTATLNAGDTIYVTYVGGQTGGAVTSLASRTYVELMPEAPVPTVVEGPLPARLSTTGEQVTDWNLAVVPGFYWSESTALNNPVGNIAVGQVLVKPVGSNPRVFQEVYFPSTGTTNIVRSWRRVNDNGTGTGTWSAWTEFGGGYNFYQTVQYTASGSFTKASYAGLRAVKVMLVGGGGAGGSGGAATTGHSAGGGGGGGGYAEAWILESALAASVTVTVGAGGTPVASAAGNTGGTSSFGSLVIASGGLGGGSKNNYTTANVPAASVGGDGGIGTWGDLLVAGNPGGLGQGLNTIGHGGAGGGSVLGGGGGPRYTGAGGGNAVGYPGRQYGGGGGGATVNSNGAAALGGAGADGIVIVEVYR